MQFLKDLTDKATKAWNSLHLFVQAGIVIVALLIAFQAIANLF